MPPLYPSRPTMAPTSDKVALHPGQAAHATMCFRHTRLGIRRVMTQKSRKKGSVLCEMCSPVAVMLLLALLWSISPVS